MTRLTKAEQVQHRSWLTSWHAPEATIAYVDQVNDHMGSADFLTQAGVTFLRDAWAAGHFGRERRADAVRLVSDQWPDFELCFCGTIARFEFVEADLKDRRRGDEYKAVTGEIEAQGFSSVEYDPVENWIARAEEAPTAVVRAIEKKLAKQYVEGASLLVMLNICEYGVRQKAIEATFPAAAAMAVHAFKEIWILWKGRAYGPWSHTL